MVRLIEFAPNDHLDGLGIGAALDGQLKTEVGAGDDLTRANRKRHSGARARCEVRRRTSDRPLRLSPRT